MEFLGGEGMTVEERTEKGSALLDKWMDSSSDEEAVENLENLINFYLDYIGEMVSGEAFEIPIMVSILEIYLTAMKRSFTPKNALIYASLKSMFEDIELSKNICTAIIPNLERFSKGKNSNE